MVGSRSVGEGEEHEAEVSELEGGTSKSVENNNVCHTG